MAFLLGLVIGLYIGVLAMSTKFKKQLKQMKEASPVASVAAPQETFTAESLASSAKTEEK